MIILLSPWLHCDKLYSILSITSTNLILLRKKTEGPSWSRDRVRLRWVADVKSQPETTFISKINYSSTCAAAFAQTMIPWPCPWPWDRHGVTPCVKLPRAVTVTGLQRIILMKFYYAFSLNVLKATSKLLRWGRIFHTLFSINMMMKPWREHESQMTA